MPFKTTLNSFPYAVFRLKYSLICGSCTITLFAAIESSAFNILAVIEHTCFPINGCS